VLAAVVRRLGAAGITGAYIFGATFSFRPEEDQTSFDPWSRQLRAVLKSAGVAEPTVVLFGDGRRVALHSDGSLEADNGSTMRLLRDSDEIIAPAAPEQDRLTIVPIRAAAVKAVKVAKVVEQAPAKQSSPPQPVPKVRQQAAVQPRPGNNRETLRRLWTFLEANGVDVMDIIGGEKTKNGVYSKHGEERQAAALVLLDPSVPSSAAVAEKLRTTEEIVNRTSRTILIHAAERLKELGIPVDPELLTLLAPRQQHKESDVPLHPVAVDIRDLRKSLGWSQERLAQMVDRSIYTIQRFEVGHTLPERGVVEQLYAALGVSQLETAKKLRGYKSGREARESTNR